MVSHLKYFAPKTISLHPVTNIKAFFGLCGKNGIQVNWSTQENVPQPGVLVVPASTPSVAHTNHLFRRRLGVYVFGG